MSIDRVDAYLESRRAAFEEQLKALLRIPSVSAQPDHDADTRRAAEFVRDDLRAMGVPAELIEAAGHPSALEACLKAVRRGGRIIQVGTLPAELPFPANSLMVRELDWRGAFRAHLEFDWAVQAIRTRRVDVRPLISAQIPLSRSQEAFELAFDRTRSTKVQLIPD